MIYNDIFSSCNKEDLALYINIPYCERPCPYCHYIANILVGYNSVPDEYFKLLLTNLEKVCKGISGCHLKSIYFGGGTPSLLTDDQLLQVRKILDDFNISADEVSIELHPNCINFTLEENSFFTRYSVGVQSFDEMTLTKYRRGGYDLNTVKDLIDVLHNNKCCTSINIDLIFKDNLPVPDVVSTLESLNPDTITIYPNTKGRGVERLVNTCCTLRNLQECFKDYKPLQHSSFIFIRRESSASKYSIIENETFGDIIGIGHNSVTMAGDKSFLTLYADNNIQVIERKTRGSRYYTSFLGSLTTGVPLSSVRRFFPILLSGHILSSVASNLDINDKHSLLNDNDLVYLPESEYIRFFDMYLAGYTDIMQKSYLSSIGFGDSNEGTIKEVYNTRLLLSTSELNRLTKQVPISNELKYKLPIPNKFILVEGIDGSGKDTFVHFFVHELKRRFYYTKNSTISVTGQPDSSLPYGVDAKRFIEDLDYESKDNVIQALNSNRVESEKRLQLMNGLRILIRGLVTDLATFNHAFSGSYTAISEGDINWDYYIVIDVDTSIADERIDKRGIPRTWREYPEYLQYFRNFYISFNSTRFANKIILENNSFDSLKFAAEDLANKIYGYEYIQHCR